MYNITVRSEDNSLLEYLEYEGTKIEGEASTYIFTSSDRFSEVLGRYIYYNLKKETLIKVVGQGAEDENLQQEIDSFLLFISEANEERWKKIITDHISVYIGEINDDVLFLEGFISFRMNSVKKKYNTYLENEYLGYLEAIEPNDSWDTLVEHVKKQNYKVEEVVIKTNSNGNITIMDKEHCVYIETQGEQENVVVQTIWAAPKSIRVIDEYSVLKKELVLIFKQVFGNRIHFS